VRWSDVVGLKDAKEAIEDAIVFPYRRSDLFPLGWPRGILLFGPPGCGKTLLAAATAYEIDAAFYNVDAASIMSKWLGESERNVADLFESARGSSETGQAAIIFMDEVDSLVGVRSEEVGGEVRMRNQFMKEMDSIVDKNKKLHVYVVGATNKPWNLDVAFLRRFQKRIYVPLPNEKTRRDILKLYAMKLLQVGEDVDFNELAQLTEGYSGSDLYDIVQAVHLKVIREFFKSGNPDDLNSKLRPNTMSDYRNILQKRRPSVSKEILNQYRQWYSRFKAL
jgi:SpoVK/Ycf46/Vps4 family AAA+-type ATPase